MIPLTRLFDRREVEALGPTDGHQVPGLVSSRPSADVRSARGCRGWLWSGRGRSFCGSVCFLVSNLARPPWLVCRGLPGDQWARAGVPSSLPAAIAVVWCCGSLRPPGDPSDGRVFPPS